MQTRTQRKAVIGNASNFWLHSTKGGFDLTRVLQSSSAPIHRRLTIKTTTTPITLAPLKTALVIIDMQNFFLSEAFGRARGAGHAALEKLRDYAIPAARKAGIQVVWLNWGLTQEDVDIMPPAVKRAFGFEAVPDLEDEAVCTREKDGIDGHIDLFAEKENGIGVDKHGNLRHKGGHVLLENGKDGRIYGGLGSSCGTIQLPESGKVVDAGRLLMRDTWNAALYPPLDMMYEEGKDLAPTPDVWIHKNRMSGMWGASTQFEEFLQEKGIRTLLFAGVNTDQCVSGTLTDAFSKGYDCVLLGDAAGTTSPQFSQECIEFNCAKTWGFLSSCEDFARAVDDIDSKNVSFPC